MENNDYYDRKESETAVKVCWYCFVGIVMWLMIAILFSGCKVHKVIENTDTRDSVRTEIVEKIVKDTVTVTVEIPAEAKERETNDSTSCLETSFARSTARLTWKGDIPFLFHSLENKPQKIEKPVEVESTEKTRTIVKTRTVTKTRTVERQLPWWKKALMWAGAAETAILLVGVILFILSIRNAKES